MTECSRSSSNRRLALAYAIAAPGLIGWWASMPRAVDAPGPLPGAEALVTLAMLGTPVVWSLWMALLLFIDRRALVRALPGFVIAFSPIALLTLMANTMKS